MVVAGRRCVAQPGRTQLPVELFCLHAIFCKAILKGLFSLVSTHGPWRGLPDGNTTACCMPHVMWRPVAMDGSLAPNRVPSVRFT